MKGRNLAFVDIETTGLLSDRHEIVQIGGLIVDQDTLTVLEEFEMKVKPLRLFDANPVSLKINGYDPSAWKEALTLSEAMLVFSQKVDSCVLVGQNVSFDFSFLERAFAETGITNTLHYHKLDTISIAYAKLAGKGLEKYSLQCLCDYLGVSNERAHTALSDAKATFEVYKKLMAL